MKKLFAAIILLVGVTVGANAQQAKVVTTDKPGWHKLGETTVDFKSDRDAITVLGNDHFKSIKFMVSDMAINIADLEVYFEDGTKQDVSVKSEVKAGGESRVINLDGNSKAIKKIVFIYKSMANAGDVKAKVSIYGMK